MSKEKPRVGCIGAGVLGAAIMRRLIDCGFAPVVWNRNPTKLAELLKAGATEAKNPAELTRSCEFVITCVSDGAAMDHVVFGDNGVAAAGSADKVLVDMSTCAAAQTRDMAVRLLEQCGIFDRRPSCQRRRLERIPVRKNLRVATRYAEVDDFTVTIGQASAHYRPKLAFLT